LALWLAPLARLGEPKVRTAPIAPPPTPVPSRRIAPRREPDGNVDAPGNEGVETTSASTSFS